MTTSPFTATRPLWFEPFLQQVKKQLGYPFDLSKYAQLLQWANNNQWSVADEPFNRLYAVCRMLFLQNPDHEEQFVEIFRNYLIDELEFEQNLKANNEHLRQVPTPAQTSDATPNDLSSPLLRGFMLSQDIMSEPPDESFKFYLNLNIVPSEKEDALDQINSAKGSRFLLNDSYLPLTTREMIHGWRHLRKKATFRSGSKIDICATVQHIAKEGLLLQPVYEKEQKYGDQSLLILADRGGSMMPFHKLTDKLIETAVKEGGHKNALVYYFYNCPVDFVYKNSSLTEPVPLTQLYSEIQSLHTVALIISDAGAARGNLNKLRALKVLEFLYGGNNNGVETTGLHKAALFVSWLNPIPSHRWKNTTANYIDRTLETPMYSIMEDSYGNFLKVIKKLKGS